MLHKTFTKLSQNFHKTSPKLLLLWVSVTDYFQHYDGGLDTAMDLTGTHSVYTTHEHIEIMFHVSTLLTESDADDNQHVAKKKFIGMFTCNNNN